MAEIHVVSVGILYVLLNNPFTLTELPCHGTG